MGCVRAHHRGSLRLFQYFLLVLDMFGVGLLHLLSQVGDGICVGGRGNGRLQQEAVVVGVGGGGG